MLTHFHNFLKQRVKSESNLFDFEDYRWESDHGEVFLLTKNLGTEMARHDQWVLCLKQNTNQGIAMFRNPDSGEYSYLYFPGDHGFLDEYLPVVKRHTQVFEIEYDLDYCILVPRNCD